MHPSSREKMEQFVHHYLGPHRDTALRVLDIGSQIVTEDDDTYRSLFDEPRWSYVGLDVEPGINVDVAVADPYRWDEIEADSVDVVISGQALEHIPYFWLTAFEICRVLRPGGITMLVAPSGGFEHRFPVDCWRFYRDGMDAIAAYVGCDVLDSYTEWGRLNWADSILVMRKPLWDTDERHRFDRRRALQYAAAFDSDRSPASSPDSQPDSPTISALCDSRPGLLSPALEEIRLAVLAAEAEPVDLVPDETAAEVDLDAQTPLEPPQGERAGNLHEPTDAHLPAWRRVARHVTPPVALDLYRRLRARR